MWFFMPRQQLIDLSPPAYMKLWLLSLCTEFEYELKSDGVVCIIFIGLHTVSHLAYEVFPIL